VTADEISALFAPFAGVQVKRMFGGHGVYADGLCFALEMDGEVFLKVDAQTREAFAAAGSSPFVHYARGKPTATSFWRLPAEADDPEALKRWASLGLLAARRNSAGRGRRPAPAGRRRSGG